MVLQAREENQTQLNYLAIKVVINSYEVYT